MPIITATELRNVLGVSVTMYSNEYLEQIIESSEQVILPLLVVSTEIFQSVVAPGGQIEGVDFAPTPYRMGRSLTSRVMALLLPYVETETIAQ